MTDHCLQRDRQAATTRRGRPLMDLTAASTLHLLDCRVRGLSSHTLLIYERSERRLIDWLRAREGREPTLSDLTAANVRAFYEWLGTQVSTYRGVSRSHGPKSLQQHIQTFKAWSGFLVAEKALPRGDPLANVKTPRVPEFEPPRFSEAECKRMLDLTAARRFPLRDRAIVLFLLETGVRVSELCTLPLSHVSLAGPNRPSGRARVMGKGSKERWVFFGARASQAITRYLKLERTDGLRLPWLFLCSGERQLTRAAVDDLVHDIGARAGITDVRCSPHTYRHSFAVQYLRKNPGQLFQLQAILGHARLEMVHHYARLASQDVENSYVSIVDGWGREPRPRKGADDDRS